MVTGVFSHHPSLIMNNMGIVEEGECIAFSLKFIFPELCTLYGSNISPVLLFVTKMIGDWVCMVTGVSLHYPTINMNNMGIIVEGGESIAFSSKFIFMEVHALYRIIGMVRLHTRILITLNKDRSVF